LKRQAALFTEADLVRFFHSLSETETKLRAATQPRYQLEVGIVKLMELRGVESIGEILRRLDSLESGSGGSAPTSTPRRSEPAASRSAQPVSSVSSVSPAFVATAAAPAPALTPDFSPFERVKSVLEAQRKRFVVTALEAALTATLENSELFVEFAPADRHLRETLLKPENAKLICDACREVTGHETGFRIAVKDPQAEGEPRNAQDEARLEKQRLREMAESSPVVQQMLKTFRGEIVDVRPPSTNE
jgi:DNA polymerase III gamma/tau subunit